MKIHEMLDRWKLFFLHTIGQPEMRFAAVVEEAFARVDHQYQSPEEVKNAKKRIRGQFRQAAKSLDQCCGMAVWPVEEVMRRLAGEALQPLTIHDWFEQVDWAIVLAAFASEASPHLGSEEQLQTVAIRAVEKWRDSEKEHKLRLFQKSGRNKAPQGKSEEMRELISKKSNPSHLDSGYKVLDSNREEPKGVKQGREVDTEIDLGFFEEVDSLGVSLQDLRVESTLPSGRAEKLLMIGDVVTSVNGTPVKSHQDFWREVEQAKPGQLMVKVLRKTSKRIEPSTSPKVVVTEVEKVDRGTGLQQAPVESTPPERSESSMIVLNCEDIGSTASKCAVFGARPSPFPWEAVRCAIKFYEDLGFMPQPVCHQATMTRHPPPPELRPKLVQCPVVDEDGRQEGRGSDRIFVINLAKTYECPFVDNSNYREQVWSGHELWPWLQKGGTALKVEYIFDSFGEFLPSREVLPRGTSSTSGRIRIHWSEYGGR